MTKYLLSALAVLTLLLSLSGWLLKQAYQDQAKYKIAAQTASQTATAWKDVVSKKDAEIARRNQILARLEAERRDAEAVAKHFMEVVDRERQTGCADYLDTELPACAVRLLCHWGLFDRATCRGHDKPLPAITYPTRPQTDFGSVGQETD